MTNKNKTFIIDTGSIDLTAYRLDTQRFSDILIKHNPINQEQAEDISRFMREAIEDLKIHTITDSMVDEVLKAKLTEYGLSRITPVKLDKTVFIKSDIPLTPNAKAVLERRYLRKDSNGNPIESPANMFRRVARFISQAEKNFGKEGEKEMRRAEMEARFYEIMTDLDFLPNSPTLMNADRDLGQLAACFVLPVDDSIEGIFNALKHAAVIHKSGGGTGFSFSRLRPKNSQVGTTGGVASGPVSFMKIFNTATEQVKQGGTRRGANMAILRVDHPDIMEFIYCKEDKAALNNFNISVGITKNFMHALHRNSDFELLDPRNGKPVGVLNAAEVYKALAKQAWVSGDPGIVFLDRLNEDNPTPKIGTIESTNPCGEQPLLPMEACNLGSINLANFVIEKKGQTEIDYPRLKEIVGAAIRFLDNTIEMSKYPLPQIEKMVKGNRKIGLGVMGFADLLFRLNIPYNSEKALLTAEKVMQFIQTESHSVSHQLAKERGVFENYKQSIFAHKKKAAYRNATATTIAPTGTLSIIANCSSGVEPLFALSFVRNVMDNDKLTEVNPWFKAVAKSHGFYSENLMDTIAKSGSIGQIEEIPKEVRDVFVTAHDISPKWHIRMQAAFQKYTDNAVSKTVNLPRNATEDDVLKIYNMAYELGCKGVTIYRDGSKENQVLSLAKPDESKADRFLTAVQDRPETLEGFTTKIRTGLGQLYITVTELEGRPFEVFATIGKSGRSTTAKTEAIGRLVSLALRSGIRVNKVIDQLKGIGGEHPIFQKGGLVLSIPDAIARVLEKQYLINGNLKKRAYGNSLLGETCPECNQTISFEEGCMTCHFCGFTKCS
jgi:ribonucleoside-diphosphate reductase alpha chain